MIIVDTTDLFVKANAPSTGTSQIIGYEYWFDDKYSSKVSQTVTPSETYTLLTNLDVTALSYGLHTFQVHFLDGPQGHRHAVPFPGADVPGPWGNAGDAGSLAARLAG